LELFLTLSLFPFAPKSRTAFSRDGWHPETEDTLPFMLWFLRFGQKAHSTDGEHGSILNKAPYILAQKEITMRYGL
jgi:hypothetical protein